MASSQCFAAMLINACVCEQLPAPVKVMSMSLSRQGKLLLTNCSDKVVRMYEVKQRSADTQGLDGQQLKAALANAEVGGTGSLLHSQDASILQLSPITFHNAVERNPWRSVVFSGDLEWVVGAVASKSDHRLYVWNRYYGKLEKILEGVGDQSAVDVAWHPCKPVLVSLSGTGRVYIWAQVHNEYWSAFAPDFQELDENVEYVEQEDEFDINQKPVANKSNADDTGNEDEQVDVVTREKVVVFSSDEEDDQAGEEPLHWLPAVSTGFLLRPMHMLQFNSAIEHNSKGCKLQVWQCGSASCCSTKTIW
eukprot:GHRR01036462.1.p1 GENE.GHRR01036462.1~~GHRR01036462.1.p1  ORF type:complete len:307 (+),score=102.22 GHRR01036462.1:690-1610(+)